LDRKVLQDLLAKLAMPAQLDRLAERRTRSDPSSRDSSGPSSSSQN
jgi:hypothetical protein